MVDLGLFVLAARPSAAFPFLFASPASCVAAFRPCGLALSPESWRHLGCFSYCFQPCVCDWFSCVWRMQDLEGLGDALLVTPAAATVYMECDLSNHAAAASAAAVRSCSLRCLKVCWGALTVTSLVSWASSCS